MQRPLTSLSDDVNATRRIMALQDGPVILVGHSWGGAVITEAGDDPKVAGLVYVAAYVPDVGQSANETSAPFGPTPGQQAIQVDAQKFASMSPEGILNSFADGLPMSERRLVLAVQGQIYGPNVRRKINPRCLEVQAVLACDLRKGPDVESGHGRSWRQEGGWKVYLPADLPRRHAAGT
jgi:pimeloyl-ACP methyl ester carboxylesterase